MVQRPRNYNNLQIKMGERIIKVRVIGIAEHVLKNDASSLYEVIE